MECLEIAQDKLLEIEELEKAQLKQSEVKEEQWQIGEDDEETKKLNEQEELMIKNINLNLDINIGEKAIRKFPKMLQLVLPYKIVIPQLRLNFLKKMNILTMNTNVFGQTRTYLMRQ